MGGSCAAGGRHTKAVAFAPVIAAAVHKSAATRGLQGRPPWISVSPRIKDSKAAEILAKASAEDPVGGRHGRALAIVATLAAAVHKSAAPPGGLHRRTAWIRLSANRAR